MQRRSLLARLGLVAVAAPLAPVALLTRAAPAAYTPAATTLQAALAQLARVGYRVTPVVQETPVNPEGWYGWVYNAEQQFVGLVANDGSVFTQVTGWGFK